MKIPSWEATVYTQVELEAKTLEIPLSCLPKLSGNPTSGSR
jgi:hypothetical protein